MTNRYGEPHPRASTWVWEDIITSERFEVRASTEMEALDRLDEQFPHRGQVRLAERRLPNRFEEGKI